MQSNINLAKPTLVRPFLRCTTSIWIDDQNDSIIGLPEKSPMVLSEGISREAGIRFGNVYQVNCIPLVGVDDLAWARLQFLIAVP